MLRKVSIAIVTVLPLLALIACGFQPDTAVPPGEPLPERAPEESSAPASIMPEEHHDTIHSVTPDFTDQVLDKRQRNPDSIGWLHVPGTDISDVILHNPPGYTNDYYLNISFDGRPDKDGVYCADRRAGFGDGTRGELSRITAIYGHSWDDDPDGGLFSQLKRYRDPDFAKGQPYLFFSTEAENMAWEVFAVFDSTIWLPYILPGLEDGEFRQMLKVVQALSIYDYDVDIDVNDKLLALSTCTYSVKGRPSLPEPNDYRYVIMARLVESNEPVLTEARMRPNEYAIAPDATLDFRSKWN